MPNDIYSFAYDKTFVDKNDIQTMVVCRIQPSDEVLNCCDAYIDDHIYRKKIHFQPHSEQQQLKICS